MNLTITKTKAILIALIAILGITMFFVGQQVLAQEVVVTEISIAVDPLGSPISNVDISLEAKAYRARVDRGALGRGYDIIETSEDNIAGAEVYFSNNMTIYNATGHVIFNRTMVFEKGADRTIEVYAPLEDVESGTEMTIVIDIELEVTLPSGAVPGTITQTIHKEITVPVGG